MIIDIGMRKEALREFSGHYFPTFDKSRGEWKRTTYWFVDMEKLAED
jgi:hypothetical protein